MSAHEILMLMQTAVTSADATPAHYKLTYQNIFLMFFIMLGPIKAIGPFYGATGALALPALRALAWKVFAFGVGAVLLAGLLGSQLLQKWQISPAIMELSAGLVFLLVALQLVLAQYGPAPHPAAPAATPAAAPAAVSGAQMMHLVFPVTVTPYGIAVLISLMALSGSFSRSLVILAIAVVVMVLNLLTMLFVRPIMHGLGMVTLQVLGAILGILQVALALQIMHGALQSLGYMAGGS
ncbi:multiple antibiotic resistance protein [Lysobacter niastensis]|uniref:UPF0056 membrane protein n=1 Tax=Lysobacter niastensis TaxID=380629 RepID=A0ABU1W9V3_9GAMM|nr:MarC family protein [Lysobacter niastensis]MDR7134328.1 multiple antibiotic resistance protein [Lysobacter niastensis]